MCEDYPDEKGYKIEKLEEPKSGKKAALVNPDDLSGAFRMFVAMTGLPLRTSTPKPGKYQVPVPNSFETLFATIKIRVDLNKFGVWEFGWEYEHPGGGTNGLRIGAFGYLEETGKWKYQLASAGWGWKDF